jgi:hypothetical protein
VRHLTDWLKPPAALAAAADCRENIMEAVRRFKDVYGKK